MQNVQKWFGLNLTTSTRDSRRNVKKTENLIKAHLQNRIVFPQARILPLPDSKYSIEPVHDDVDQVVPPDAELQHQEWPRDLLLHPPKPLESYGGSNVSKD